MSFSPDVVTSMSSGRRNVAVFTGHRAEFGLLQPIIHAMAYDRRLHPLIVASGSHVATARDPFVGADAIPGVPVYATEPIRFHADSLADSTRGIGATIVAVSHLLERLSPDVLLVYGDRSEAFAAAVAATQMGIPTAHIEGGDYTDGGALDDSVRHAITKLAHLHFTTNTPAAQRVLGLGEEPWRVFDVGYPTLDRIAAGDFATAAECAERFALESDRPLLVFTQHPVTTEAALSGQQLLPSLRALEMAVARWNCQVVITGCNGDAGSTGMQSEFAHIAHLTPGSVRIHGTVGRYYYHGLLAMAAACVGNSSSGIKETPAFHCPTVNIGTRQRGRLRATNVIDTEYETTAIVAAIDRCLHDMEFLAHVQHGRNPYGSGDTGRRISDVLATIPFDSRLLQKQMTF